MIARLIDQFFLFNYQDADFITRQKVIVLSRILITAAILVACLFSYHLFLQRPLGVAIMRSFAFISCLFVLLMIRRGRFSIAGHVALTAILITIWSVMLIDRGELSAKIDTIALGFAAFSSSPLVLDRKKWSIFIYAGINICLLVIFTLQLRDQYGLSDLISLEFFLDNFIAFIFVAMISYQVIAINYRALDKANESILTAEKEAEKNRLLSESLEAKVKQRTKELLDNNVELQREIGEREKAEVNLRAAQEKLVENAHKAGMAEIASDTLHNVGNVLNSIKTSAHMIETSVRPRPDASFSRAVELIKENQNNLSDFLNQDPKGQKLLEYLYKLEDEFKYVFDQIEGNTQRLNEKIATIAEVIVAQQSHAGTLSYTVTADITEIINNALTLIPELIGDQKIRILKEFSQIPKLRIQKTKLLHTLVNLFKNAAQAMTKNQEDDRFIKIKVHEVGKEVLIEITDNGEGIEPKNLTKIFSHGFTTKKEGYGFGLHSCANYLQEMGATIDVKSDGPDTGATFIMRFSV